MILLLGKNHIYIRNIRYKKVKNNCFKICGTDRGTGLKENGSK